MPIQADRRQVLRTGMWAVPVVAVATAAPAFATSGANLATSSAVVARVINKQQITAVVTLSNSTGTGSTSHPLTLSITIPGGLDVLSAQPAPPTGWTLTSVDTANNVIVFTRVAAQQLAAGESVTSTFVIQRTSNGTGNVGFVAQDGSGGAGWNTSYPVA